jgi:hypothetical protein
MRRLAPEGSFFVASSHLCSHFYSGFGSTFYRVNAAEWLFPEKRVTRVERKVAALSTPPRDGRRQGYPLAAISFLS